jgi:hypothetical protein
MPAKSPAADTRKTNLDIGRDKHIGEINAGKKRSL